MRHITIAQHLKVKNINPVSCEDGLKLLQQNQETNTFKKTNIHLAKNHKNNIVFTQPDLDLIEKYNLIQVINILTIRGLRHNLISELLGINVTTIRRIASKANLQLEDLIQKPKIRPYKKTNASLTNTLETEILTWLKTQNQGKTKQEITYYVVENLPLALEIHNLDQQKLLSNVKNSLINLQKQNQILNLKNKDTKLFEWFYKLGG